MINLTEVLKEVQGLKSQIGDLKKDLAVKKLEVNYKDLVKIVINGKQEIISFTINSEVLGKEKDELEEICRKAVNLAIKNSQDMIYGMNDLGLGNETT